MIYAAYTITYTIASLLIGRKLYDKWNAYNSSVAGYEAERSFKNKTWKYERVPTLAVTLYIPIGAVLLCLWNVGTGLELSSTLIQSACSFLGAIATAESVSIWTRKGLPNKQMSDCYTRFKNRTGAALICLAIHALSVGIWNYGLTAFLLAWGTIAATQITFIIYRSTK